MAEEERPERNKREEEATPTPTREISTNARERKSSRRRGSRRSRRGRPQSGDLFLVLVVFAVVLTFFMFEPGRVIDALYNPTAGLILIIMAVQFLVLKSMDRTRVYQLENTRLREQRRTDRVLLKQAGEVLGDPLDNIDEMDEEERNRWKARCQLLAQEIRDRL